MTETPRIVLIFLALALIITLCLYFPGLSGGFIFDDVPRIKNNQLLAIDGLEYTQLKQAFFSSTDRFPSSRPLSMLSFGINHAFTGLNPSYFKLTNVAIHLWTGLAIFILVQLLISTFAAIRGLKFGEDRIAWVALVVSAAWMLHPINLTPVLYVVQRMTSLSALFSIHALICYVVGRRQMWEGRGGVPLILLGFLLFGSLAFMSKENAVLLPLLILTIELCLFRFAVSNAAGRRFLIGFFLLTVAMPFIGCLIYILINPDWLLGGYVRRSFSLVERPLTEARIIWFYLRLIFIPDSASLGFFHDDIAVSRGLLEPITTLPALLGLGGLIVAAFYSRSRAPVLSFGILFFLAGHTLESTIFPLELAFEHRNYLPSLGPIFALFYYLLHPLSSGRQRRAASILAVSVIAWSSVVSADRADYWGGLKTLYLTEAEHHPDSPRANYVAGAIYQRQFELGLGPSNAYERAKHHMEEVTRLSPRNSHGLFGAIIVNLQAGRPVPQEWLNELEFRLKHYPYAPENANFTQFKSLIEAQFGEGNVRLEKEQMLTLFEAVLSNPLVSKSKKRAEIYSALALYHHGALRQPEQALSYARHAVEIRPERLGLRSSLIEILVDLGQFEDAREQVMEAEAIDKSGRFSYALARLRRKIAANEVGADK